LHLLATGIALLVSYFVCTLVHELAHLLATWAVGWKPFTLSLGFGRRQTLFQIGDVRFQIGSQPFGGFVEFVALKPSYFRLKWFVIVAAGPFATAMLFLLIYSTLRWPLPETWRIAVQSLLIGEAASLLFCLWPMRFDFGGMSLSNDGLQMWQAVRMKRGEIPELFTSHVMEHVQRLLETGRGGEAQKLVDQTMADLGAPSTLDQKILYLHVLMLCGREGAANGVLDELLSTGTPPGLTRSQFLDTLACFPLFFRYGHLIPRAIAWVDEAIRLEPDRITCKGNEGIAPRRERRIRSRVGVARGSAPCEHLGGRSGD